MILPLGHRDKHGSNFLAVKDLALSAFFFLGGGGGVVSVGFRIFRQAGVGCVVTCGPGIAAPGCFWVKESRFCKGLNNFA